MKKIVSLFLLTATMFSLSSCIFAQFPEKIISNLGNDFNREQEYSPCTEDFASTDTPLGEIDSFCEFTPSRDALYYFSYDSFGITALYRATTEGTECIAKENNDTLEGHYLDDGFKALATMFISRPIKAPYCHPQAFCLNMMQVKIRSRLLWKRNLISVSGR